jgi:tetratricopeptide (TPR) repeat protein
MKSRFHIALFLLCFLALSTHAFSQDNQDNQPHIQPRNQPTATPTPQTQPTPKPSDDQYERPPFPGETQKQPPLDPNQAAPSRKDGYDRPAFPGDAPGTNPTGGSATGESSSKDTQINLNASPIEKEASRPADDESVLRPWDPHKAAKDVEVGNYYLKLKNYRAALERFNHALTYQDNDAEAMYGLAYTQEKLELLSAADRTYRKYLQVLPNGPRAKEAQEALKRIAPQVASHGPAADASDPGQARIAEHDRNVGETYLAGNNFDAARQRFEEALRITPDDPLLFFRMAQALQGMQRLDPARIYYRKYLEAQPKGKFAKDAKKQIDQINWVLGK